MGTPLPHQNFTMSLLGVEQTLKDQRKT